MKYLLLPAFLFFIGCEDVNVVKEPPPKQTSPLVEIQDGTNFKVYLLKRDGNEYIIVNGINGVAITKR